MISRKQVVRSFRKGDEKSFPNLVNIAYRNLERLTQDRVKRLTSSPYFSADGFFIAEKHDQPVGCVGVFNLPAKGYLETRYLAVVDAWSNRAVVDSLVDTALRFSASKRCRLLKAVTPTIQPYVDAYKRAGFKPVRRILRIAWDPIKLPEERVEHGMAVSEIANGDINAVARVFVKGAKPYWDWWIEEEGGSETLQKRAADWIRQSEGFVAKVNRKIVGYTAVVPHPERREAGFHGVLVLPEFRMKGIGSALMNAALNKATQMGYKRLVVHTLAYLDALAPGAVLYLKSGGRIEAEYLHLYKDTGT